MSVEKIGKSLCLTLIAIAETDVSRAAPPIDVALELASTDGEIKDGDQVTVQVIVEAVHYTKDTDGKPIKHIERKQALYKHYEKEGRT